MSRKLRQGPRRLAVRPNERKSESSRQRLPSERKPRGSGASPPALLPEVDLWIKAHPQKPSVTLLSSSVRKGLPALLQSRSGGVVSSCMPSAIADSAMLYEYWIGNAGVR